MAGDRGLAFVLFGLIALGILWRVEWRQSPVATVQPAQMISAPRTILEARRPDKRDIGRDLGRSIRGDYRLLHDRVNQFAGATEYSEVPLILDPLIPDPIDRDAGDQR